MAGYHVSSPVHPTACSSTIAGASGRGPGVSVTNVGPSGRSTMAPPGTIAHGMWTRRPSRSRALSPIMPPRLEHVTVWGVSGPTEAGLAVAEVARSALSGDARNLEWKSLAAAG